VARPVAGRLREATLPSCRSATRNALSS
jgi:hypothetical protein